MTSSPRSNSAIPAVECRIRYVEGAGGPLAPATVAEMSSLVAERAGKWASQIGSFLQVDPPASVALTLYGGRCVPRTRGTEIVLPAGDGVDAVVAGLAHELVHAVAGHSSHALLNEGLAVHVDSELRQAGPGWPFYHLAPDRWMAVFREEGWQLSLDDLLSMGLLRPVGEEHLSVRDRAVRYIHAASLAGYLLHHLPRHEFWDGFRCGRLPGCSDPSALERGWLAWLGTAPLTPDERARRDRSFGIGSHAQAGTGPRPSTAPGILR